MKKLLLLSVFAVLLGCKKDNAVNTSLIGKWEYRGRSCYCTPEDPAAIKPGNGTIITFSASNYYRYANGSLVKSGTYKTAKFQPIGGGATVDRIIYDNNNSTADTSLVFFKVDNKKLTLYGSIPLAADGPEYYYERQ